MSKGGNAPQPVNPYQQAAAQYGLNTGTATYNAALNRTGNVNPLGSSGWNVNGFSGYGAEPPGFSSYSPGGYSSYPYGLGGGDPNAGLISGVGEGAPLYTSYTQLAPQFESVLQQPINTSNVPGMPGGPDLSSTIGGAEQAAFGQQMNFLAPQEAAQTKAQDAQLAAEGVLPGSEAYDTAKTLLSGEQARENTQVANQAVTTGLSELPMLYGLGTTSLQNQLNERGGIINEFNALNPGTGSPVSVSPTDITGPFASQYQGQLAGYNANTAAANANTEAGAGLLSSYLMYLALASDRRVKDDIKKVGKLDSGENVYTFRYKNGDPRTHMGVMAQEIEESKPDAVFNLGGTKFVNYGAI